MTWKMRHEQGMTLIEILVAVSLVSILLTLSAGSLRTYWLTQAVERAKGELLAQLQRQQERVVSESHPLSFGVRVRPGSSQWALVSYNPGADLTTSADDVCTVTEQSFADGVAVSAAEFSAPTGIDVSKCAGNAGARFIIFYARGTATDGQLTLVHSGSSNTRSLRIVGLTGKVREV